MAVTVDILNKEGEKTGEYMFKSDRFGGEVHPYVIYEAIKNQLANKRQGTSSTKTRAEVHGTTRKPWRQKGTGRARVGSSKSPLWRGGGIIFGPKPRDYSYRIPKKIRQSAFVSVMNLHLKEKTLKVLEDIEMQAYKTKEMHRILLKLTKGKKVLLVLNAKQKETYKYLRVSSRNLAWVVPCHYESIEIKDFYYAREVVFLRSSIEALDERVGRFAWEKSAQKAAADGYERKEVTKP